MSVVERLWQLQSELSNLAEKEKALNTRPAGFARVDEEYEQSKKRLDELSSRIAELQRQRRDIETDMQAEQEQLKKYQGQLMQVKNQQQYAAAWKEIDTARKKVKEFEDETLRKMGEIEELETELNGIRGAFADLESRHRAAYDEWQSSLGDLKGEADALRSKIEALESGIPDPLKREFHQIYKQRQGVAMARVLDGSCGACRVRIRPQVLQQLKRGELGRCEACRRILYP